MARLRSLARPGLTILQYPVPFPAFHPLSLLSHSPPPLFITLSLSPPLLLLSLSFSLLPLYPSPSLPLPSPSLLLFSPPSLPLLLPPPPLSSLLLPLSSPSLLLSPSLSSPLDRVGAWLLSPGSCSRSSWPPRSPPRPRLARSLGLRRRPHSPAGQALPAWGPSCPAPAPAPPWPAPPPRALRAPPLPHRGPPSPPKLHSPLGIDAAGPTTLSFVGMARCPASSCSPTPRPSRPGQRVPRHRRPGEDPPSRA